MSDPESIEAVAKIRDYIVQLVQGLNFIPDLPMAQKVRAVREAVALQGHSWDPDEGILWSEMIEHVEAGEPLSDAYLIDWRHGYRVGIGIGRF